MAVAVAVVAAAAAVVIVVIVIVVVVMLNCGKRGPAAAKYRGYKGYVYPTVHLLVSRVPY
jgi:hypothetical protein